jgi:hypothetical protein
MARWTCRSEPGEQAFGVARTSLDHDPAMIPHTPRTADALVTTSVPELFEHLGRVGDWVWRAEIFLASVASSFTLRQ